MSGSSGSGNYGRMRGTASSSVTWLDSCRAAAGNASSRQKPTMIRRLITASFQFAGDGGIGADILHRRIHMRQLEEEAVEQAEMPGHLARHIQEQHGADIIGFIGRFMQEGVV